jgi:predicted dehydrogenase
MREGKLGEVKLAKSIIYSGRGSIGGPAECVMPPRCDYDLWAGPAPLTKLTRPKFHYDWHWFWDTGNGEIGNQGVHEMDIAFWGHNRGLPTSVHSAGGRFGLDDDGQAPNTQATTFAYADGTIMTFEVRNLGSFEEADGGNCGNSFFGTKGYYVRGKGFFSYKENKGGSRESIPVPDSASKGEKGDKWQRWVRAIRSRNPADLPVSPLDAHHSCCHCHLGNLAFRAGRSLAFDPKTERFTESALNPQLTRDYRKNFEVPQIA